jgi:hypothetical protein
MKNKLQLIIQILFCLLLPLIRFQIEMKIQPYIRSLHPDLSFTISMMIMTGLSVLVYRWSSATLRHKKEKTLMAIATAYASVSVGTIIIYYLPHEALFSYLDGRWLYFKNNLTINQVHNLLPEVRDSGSEFSFVELVKTIIFASWEELILRGVILGALVKSFERAGVRSEIGLPSALLLSALTFVLFHDLPRIATYGLGLFVMGLIAGLIFMRFGLIYACLFHSLYNISGAPFFFDANRQQNWAGFWYSVGSLLALVLLLTVESRRLWKRKVRVETASPKAGCC